MGKVIDNLKDCIDIKIISEQQVKDRLITEYCYNGCEDYIQCSLNGFKKLSLSTYCIDTIKKQKGKVCGFSKIITSGGWNCIFICMGISASKNVEK